MMETMIATAFWENPAVVGLVIAIPATILGYLGYRRSRDMDAAAKQAGVVGGWNDFIKTVQDDNRSLREEVKGIRARLDAIETGSDALRVENRALRQENADLHAEVAENKAEIERLKARISELEQHK